MSQGDVKYARALPKDKIYRNIFEAEQNLNKSLKKERKITKAKREPTLPVLKQPIRFTDGSGILSQRQKTWVEANPNEPHVENPTYHRYLRLDEQEKNTKAESFYDAQEVRGLPDVNVEQRDGSAKSRSVVEKISENRKERHDAALEEFHQELGIISSELEPRIAEGSEILKDGFAANDKELSKVMQLFSDDKDLATYSLENLHKLWECIAEISYSRQEYIVDLAKTFEAIEQDRYVMVCETFKKFNTRFEDIAYLMSADVHRMMEEQAEEINSTMICNRKAYADLVATLHKGAVELERKYYHVWETRVKSWKELKTKEAVQEFVAFMNSTEIRQPPQVLRCLEDMREKQNVLNTKRLDLLNSLRNMKPPGSTKAAVYQWNNALGHVTDQLDKTNKRYREFVQEAYDQVMQNCFERMETTKSKLEEDNIVNGEELNTIINELFLPLIGEKKTRYECEMDIFEKTVENLTMFQDTLVRSLFKFVQGAAHVWDTHEIGVARQERALQEDLEAGRHRHDGANQVKEANLDIIMDKMRQESSQETLEKSLTQASSLLEEIQQGYKIFHSEQLECVRKYPDKIKDQLDIYDREMCAYFAVDRNRPQPAKKQPRSVGSSPSGSPRQGRSPREISPHAETLEEVLKTSNGTTFYVITYQGDYGFPSSSVSVRSMKTSMTFLTDAPDLDDYNTLYTERILIDEELFVELRKLLRMQFLESLETWKIEAMERANSVVAAKVEELNSELDLRLHLHKPRSARAEQDVHNVRAAELVMHQERVERHSKGISVTLNEFKTRFQTMIEEHNDETDKFKKTVQALEVTFTSATKTHELVAVQDHVSGQIEGYMNEIRTSLRKFRQDLDGMLSSLRNSNARFRKSFKVFSEGGNFSLDEVDDYKRKLERMANKIDQAEGTIMAELEGMESKRLESALECAGKLEDRFKHHLFDLTFMEKSSRWVTNTQVKIKTEVAKSNSQAKNLVMSLAKIERRIDAVKNPNLDKEQVTCEDILDDLRDVFKLFIERSLFLDCLLIDPKSCHTALTEKDLPYVTEATEQVSKGKTKDIKRSSKGSKRNISVEKLTTQSPAINAPTIETQQRSFLDVRPKTMPADLERKPTFKHSAQMLAMRMNRSSTGRRPSASRRDFLTKFDKKYLIFGDKTDEEPKDDFLARILHILRSSLDGFLATAEAYYRQKGPRLATRPTIHDNFDAYAQATVQRLQSYKAQTDDYHNSSIQELRGHLRKLQSLVVQVPEMVIESFVRDHSDQTDVVVERIKKENGETVATLENQRKQHEGQLRPALGHPKNREELEGLKNVEKERSTLRMKVLSDYMDELKGHRVERAKSFVEILSKTSAEMLRLFDALVTVDDVKLGKVDEKPKSTKQILLEKTKPPKTEQEKESEYYSKPGRKWQGLPTNELVLKPSDTLRRTLSLATSKTTAAHQSVLEARNKAYKAYKSGFFARINEINKSGEDSSYEEERWREKWHLSLERIQNLH